MYGVDEVEFCSYVVAIAVAGVVTDPGHGGNVVVRASIDPGQGGNVVVLGFGVAAQRCRIEDVEKIRFLPLNFGGRCLWCNPVGGRTGVHVGDPAAAVVRCVVELRRAHEGLDETPAA